MNSAVVNGCYYHEQYGPKEKITAAEAVLAAENAFYPDGDYGKCWRHVVYNHDHLADWYAALGDTETALAHLQKSAALAAKYDKLPQLCAHTSPLVKGLEVDFGKALSKSGDTTLSGHMKYLFLESEKGK